MFRAPASWGTNSLKIAGVLEDIGVNERMILRRRRHAVLQETMETITARLTGENISSYHLGSKAEGTTILGLSSDSDVLFCYNRFNVIQNWEEWKPGVINLMMIQDENTTPGYCFLQMLYSDVPLPVTVDKAEYENSAIYKRDKVINKNTFLKKIKLKRIIKMKNDSFNISESHTQTREGAAWTLSQRGYADLDLVLAYPFTSFPRSVRKWLYQQSQKGNISNPIKRYFERNPCFVVKTGCKGSPYEEYEWRISTSLIERCLMFNLNITQIQCYVMMKLILKTYLDHPYGKLLSSFVCKNILLLCIECISPSDLWKPRNLLHVFTFCLVRMKQFVLSGECPHFIIHENNLLRRKLNSESKLWLVDRIDFVIQSYGCAFLGVKIDDFDGRLMSKFNIRHETIKIADTPEFISMKISCNLVFVTAMNIKKCSKGCLNAVMSGESDLSNIIRFLAEKYSRGCKLEQAACRLFTPLLCSTLGSIKASEEIRRGSDVSSEALTWLTIGLNSDVSFGRLKLASVLYCAGDVDRAEVILRQIEEHYHMVEVEAVCNCCVLPAGHRISLQFMAFADTENEDAIQHYTATCVNFLPIEIHCIPHELQYEMFRSTPEDMPHRGFLDSWMDWAVIDSLPFINFLQYKTYNRLQRYGEKQISLLKFAISTFTTRNLGHRETALNLLGQCMEQENQHQLALYCYVMSLHVRQRNNVAKIHICRLISSLLQT